MSAKSSLFNSHSSYGWVSIILHWVTALAVIALFSLGLYMDDMDYADPLYKTLPHLHKSFGVLLIILVIFRLVWRESGDKPQAMTNHKPWERLVSKVVHYFLYIALILMFPTGYLITTAAGKGLEVFDWFVIPSIISDIDNLEDYAGEIHELMAFTIVGVAIVHAAGALKHHFIDKDDTLMRILRRKP